MHLSIAQLSGSQRTDASQFRTVGSAGVTLAQLPALVEQIRRDSGYTSTKEQATAEAINRHPSLYDEYLKQHPVQR